MARRSQARTEPKPPNRLSRIALLKSVLQAFRSRMDEELQPLGLTTAQLRMLWIVEQNPGVSGAEISRLCGVTPQSGQATMARMEENGWVRRKPGATSERVLVAELTASGRKLLQQGGKVAEALDHRIWDEASSRDLEAMDTALAQALQRLARGR